jgi:hypothetical protein
MSPASFRASETVRIVTEEGIMSVSNKDAAGYTYSSDMAAGIRFRTGLLVLLASASVALAFGLSFYFALVSNQTAVARQFPELASIVERLKSLLVVNTFGFVAIVIASFWVLSRLVSARIFIPLGSIMKEMRQASENRLPQSHERPSGGAFGDFSRQWGIVLSTIRENEEREIELLKKSLESPSLTPGSETASILREMLDAKELRLSAGQRQQSDEGAVDDPSDNTLFMQPV